MTPMDDTIRIRGLSKHYGKNRVLDELDLELGPGVTGILGPNGAGKTTLLRCLATTLAPDDGQISALGLDPSNWAERGKLRRRLGYLPQNPGYYRNFTTFELVDYVAILKELTDRTKRHAEVRRVLAEVELTDRATTKVGKLSGGMRQRLALAQALLADPTLLILDEPTVGLDPEQRTRFRGLISQLGRQRVVLLSTHQTEDVAALCERVIVLLTGRVVFDGSTAELASIASGQVWLSNQSSTARYSWRTADGRFRTLGEQPPRGEPTPPTIEDGYLLLTNAGTDVSVTA